MGSINLFKGNDFNALSKRRNVNSNIFPHHKEMRKSMKDAMELVVGDNLEVVYIGGSKKYFNIRGIDNMFLRDEHDAITSGSVESYTAVNNLNPPTDQLYWVFGMGKGSSLF